MSRLGLILIIIEVGLNSEAAIEIKGTHTLDTWYGTWYGIFEGMVDTHGVSENMLSIRVFKSNLKGALDILHTIYWDRDFHLKDTSSTHITWKSLEFESPSIYVTLGDFYSTFGQGLVLSMERNDLVQREHLLEGIKVETKLPQFEVVQIWATPYEIDRLQKNYERLNDTSDVLFGVKASYKINLGNYIFSLSGCGVRFNLKDALYTNLCGGGVEVKNSWLTWYTELVGKFGWDRAVREEREGSGIYSSLDIIPFGINLQVMNYDTLGVGNGDYKYNLLPVLNHSGYQIDEGLSQSRNGIGFQICVAKPIKDIIVSISHSEVENKDPVYHKGITEYYLKVENTNSYSSLKYLSLTGGVDFRFDVRQELECEFYRSFKNIGTTVSLSKVKVTHMDSVIPFTDVELNVQLPVLEIVTIYLAYAYRSKEIIIECPGTQWYNIGMRVQPSSRIFLESSISKEKGGLICSGGMCRWAKPFEGIKLKLDVSL